MGLKSVYKRLHQACLVDIDFLSCIFENSDAYMRDTVVAEGANISSDDMKIVKELVTEICKPVVAEAEPAHSKKSKKEKKSKKD